MSTNRNTRKPQNSQSPQNSGKAGQADARERLRTARAVEEQRRQRARRVGLGAAVAATVAVIAVGAVVVSNLGNGSSSKSGGSSSADQAAAASQKLVVPAHVSSTDSTVIVYGDPKAKHTLDIYEDFRCPICHKLEEADGRTIQQLADNGTYKIQYHLATFLDDNLGGSGSKDALQVAGAALNESVAKFKAFHDVLYANQPEETTDGFGDLNHLLDLAGKVPGLVTPEFTKEVKDRVYAPWAAKVSQAFNASGVQGTPTLKLDGQQLNVFDSTGNPISTDAYTALVQQTVGAK
ncbi:thioredoxin domain-containing protein [Streptacidiphilus jiangxiensis]|uniref:Protein-disulfide isomerase n=1 Tax=Streptacidiphilus jiangxiensis TaxID=235985 RepID=A0A1H7XN65_STRJI|nr:thioredoxin domain-containing protein [Streptacidiphilus jiangxiensis]SEM35093.1 Protein-disulfide isomerase [Streptacidiphilus jiangxiensis]